jgi:molybdopterin converting factor small subunit
MPVLFVIPGALRELAGNRAEVRVEGAPRSIAAALSLLWAECPAVRDRVMTERGEVRPHINVFVDGENIRASGGLDAPVKDDAEIMLLPAISGG